MTAGSDVVHRTSVDWSEQALVSAHRQLQSIIDNTTSIVYAFDLEERFLLANAALAELFSTTPEQMIGETRHEFMPKEDADWHETNDRKVVEAGKALEFEEYSKLQDRSITWLTTKFPLRDEQGKIYAVGGISSDVSERKQAEEALRRSEARFKSLAENVPSVLQRFDRELRVVYLSPLAEKEHGIPVEQFIGKTNREMGMPEDLCDLWEKVMREVLDTGEPRDVEFAFPSIQGPKTFLLRLAPEFGADSNQVEYILGISTDITERKQAEEELRKAYDREKHIAEELQKAVIPPTPTIGDGYRVASTYIPATADELVGGDFYDIFRLSGGRVGIVIGDVSGKGVDAAEDRAVDIERRSGYPGQLIHVARAQV